MAETAKWISKVEGISLEAAVSRVSAEWEEAQLKAEHAQIAQQKRELSSRSKNVLEEGKKPLTTSLGDLLKGKFK